MDALGSAGPFLRLGPDADAFRQGKAQRVVVLEKEPAGAWLCALVLPPLESERREKRINFTSE